jgi:hypothetical protein
MFVKSYSLAYVIISSIGPCLGWSSGKFDLLLDSYL